ncbi:MAG TPA: DUF6259 domain-containing protein [Chthoniobacter sp.]
MNTPRGLFLRHTLIWLALLSGVRAIAKPQKATALKGLPAPVFDAGKATVHVVEQENFVGLANSRVAFLFRRNGSLAGIWPAAQGNLLAASPVTPLWSLEVAAPGPEKTAAISSEGTGEVSFATHGDESAMTLDVTYHKKEALVVVHASLDAEASLIRWRIEVGVQGPEASLWSVNFPQFPAAALDTEPTGNEMLVPYRRGQTRVFGRGAARGDADLPYPGPSAKFQFLAAYGRAAGRGFYLAAEDGAGFTKSFAIRNRPEAGAAVLAVQHFPANRGLGVKHFAMEYDVVAGPFAGDWWDAARLYRTWWVKQKWASRGLLAERKDLPAWLVRAPFAVRPSTTKPERTVANNVTALQSLSAAFEHRPFFGVWYGCFETPTASTSLNQSGLGHDLPPKTGLVDAVRSLRTQGVHLQAYIQSMIYDAGIVTPDADAAQHAVIRDRQGNAVPYGTGDPPQLLAMCRATDWWQRRLVELSRRAVAEWGFSGVYLDSFGKGAPECFAQDHGHDVGGGNTVIAGQRVLARRVREAIRSVDPEAILSGEDPIEAFRDLLDVNLYSVNTMPGYVPVYRTVWGDYSLGHGRVLGPGKAGGSLLPELATLFLEGTIPGRIYADSPDVFLLQPAHARELAFLRSIDAYTQQGLEWLRLGEYLHPLVLSPPPATIEFRESVENKLVRVPSIAHSVTRSHTDGSIAIVLINLAEQLQDISVPIDPKLRGEGKHDPEARLQRMNEQGALTELSRGHGTWSQKLTLAPGEVAFLVLR